MTLEQLREQNSGYNPEKLDLHYLILSDLGDEILVARKDEFTGNKDKNESWMKVSSANEEEFIIHFPKTYGLIHEGKFYIRAEDFYS